MIWFIIGGLYSIALITIGFYLGYKIMPKTIYQPTTQTTSEPTAPKNQNSGALKAMSPQERNLEASKEIRERIEYLIK